MKRPFRSLFLSLLVCGSLSSARAATPTRESGDAAATPAATSEASARLSTESLRSRLVKYGERDVIPVRAKLSYTTMIILPKEERILDFTCGDKDYWAVEGNENFAFIKPAKAGSSTNVNLITASGNVYSLVLTEVSESDVREPDVKVFVEPKDQSMLSAARREPRFALRKYECGGVLKTNYNFAVTKADRTVLWHLPNQVGGVTLMLPEDY